MNATGHALVCAILVGSGASHAMACGHCIEDRVAAVYDHAMVSRAMASKHPVVFFAIEGNIPAGGKSRRSLKAIVESVAGVDKGSARVSVESESLCISFNPALASFASMERALTRKLESQGLSVSILRVMDSSPQLEEVRR